MFHTRFAVVLVIGFGAIRSTCAASDTVVASAESSITHDSDERLWTVANATLLFQVRADTGIDSQLMQLSAPGGGWRWNVRDASDATLIVDGTSVRVGRQADGFFTTNVRAMARAHGVELAVQSLFRRLSVTRHYALYDGSPTLEVWTSVTALSGRSHTLADLNALTLTIPNGTVRWVNGLQGDNADVDDPTAFTLQSQTLGEGQQLSVGSTRRSSEQVLPWVVVEGSQQTFFAGVMWSGGWNLTLTGRGSMMTLNASLGAMSTTPEPGETETLWPSRLCSSVAATESVIERQVSRVPARSQSPAGSRVSIRPRWAPTCSSIPFARETKASQCWRSCERLRCAATSVRDFHSDGPRSSGCPPDSRFENRAKKRGPAVMVIS